VKKSLIGISRIFLFLCLSFSGGIFFHFLISGRAQSAIFFFFAICLLAASFFLKKKGIKILALCSFAFALGFFRAELAAKKIARPELESFANQEISSFGQVVDDPERGLTRIKARVRLFSLEADVLVFSGLFPKIKYGDQLKIKGVLRQPEKQEGFDYQAYLERQGIYFLMNYPEIEVTKSKTASPWRFALISFKEKLKESLGKVVPFSQAGLFEALLFGEEQNVSQSWKEKLNITGTRHIAAVSGANITILTGLLLDFLLFLGFWRQKALWFSLALIFAYILMIGAPASALRAGILAVLILFCQFCGRVADPERLIIIALTVMLFFNPFSISDIGFQLSFLAVFGLIYFNQFFSLIFQKLPNFLDLRKNLASTLAAQVLVFPLLLFSFGQFSFVSPLANILILPAIPFLTIFGFLFSLLGMVSLTLGQIISLPAQLLLQLVIKVIDFFSLLPFASQRIRISSSFIFLLYLFLAILIYFLRKKQQTKFLNY